MNLKNFQDVFRFAKIYEKSKSSINKHDPWGVFATQALEGIKRDLEGFINQNYEPFSYDVSSSQGGPSMPRVPWVAITARRTRVSVSPSYTICFGRKGDGFVHGLMLPASINFDKLEPQKRSCGQSFIDINGTKSELKYNDRYINPLDVYPEMIDPVDIYSHIKSSLTILDLI